MAEVTIPAETAVPEAETPHSPGLQAPATITLTLSLAEFEQLLRRIVRGEVARLLTTKPTIAEDWSQEGPEDPVGDEELAQEALAVLAEYGEKPEAWTGWEEFEKELDRTEAAGALAD
jgi:hypothetical protein